MATKIGIILLPSFFFLSFLPHSSKSEGGQRTGAKRRVLALRFVFLVGSGMWSACVSTPLGTRIFNPKVKAIVASKVELKVVLGD